MCFRFPPARTCPSSDLQLTRMVFALSLLTRKVNFSLSGNAQMTTSGAILPSAGHAGLVDTPLSPSSRQGPGYHACPENAHASPFRTRVFHSDSPALPIRSFAVFQRAAVRLPGQPSPAIVGPWAELEMSCNIHRNNCFIPRA